MAWNQDIYREEALIPSAGRSGESGYLSEAS